MVARRCLTQTPPQTLAGTTGREQRDPVSKPDSIILVHPPLVSAAAPPRLPALAAARLEAAGVAAEVYDANQDFVVNCLLSPGRLLEMAELAAARARTRGCEGLVEPRLEALAQDLAQGPDKWQGRCQEARQVAGAFRGERFYDPQSLVAARREMDDLLALASLAHFPLRLHWNGLHHPGVADWNSALAFSRDPGNPFGPLRQRLWERIQGARAMVLCVLRPDQLLAALSLLEMAREKRSGLEVLFWGPGLGVSPPPPGLGWLYGDDPAALCAALGLPDPGDRPPDYSGLDGYLAPELVKDGVEVLQPGQVPAREELESRRAAGLGVIRWQVEPGTEPGALEAALRATSRLGLWNQVELPAAGGGDGGGDGGGAGGGDGGGGGDRLAAWCAANPNLAHSVVQPLLPATGFSGPPPASLPEPKVGDLPPMPGRPLWRWLDAPAHLLLYVRKQGVAKTRCQRVRADGTVYRLGEAVEYYFVRYPELDPPQVDRILELILSAGKVKPNWLRRNLEQAYLIAYAMEEGMMVATETLKRPRPEYIQKVRQRTGLDFSEHLERGYIVVRPEYRGLGVGDELVRGCLARAQGKKTFLVIAEDNKTAQMLTARHGSRPLFSYYSEEMGKEVAIWTPRDQDD